MNNCLVDLIEQYFAGITKPGVSKTLCVNMQEVVGFTANTLNAGLKSHVVGGRVSVVLRGGGALECRFDTDAWVNEGHFDQCVAILRKDLLAAQR